MRLAILPGASPSNLKGTCKPSPGATAGIWVLSRALTPRTAGKDEDTSGELRNTASSRLLRQKSTCSCQNHEREWTLTWVGCPYAHPPRSNRPAPAVPVCPWERASLWPPEGSKSQQWWHKAPLSAKKSSEKMLKNRISTDESPQDQEFKAAQWRRRSK